MNIHPNTQIPRARRSRRSLSVAQGFTLVEILVVLAIIAILAALLFPAFKNAQENGRQASCATNMQQLFLAVKLYYDDEKKYPANLAVLLPKEEKLDNTNVTTPATKINNVDKSCDPVASCVNVRGTGHLKSTNSLVCPGDDTISQGLLRSSYSNVATGTKGSPADATADLGRYVWNYWGYKEDGFAYDKDEAAYATAISTDKRYLRDPNQTYNATSNPVDPQKLPRLANRQAPAETIITHCVYHRLPTSNMAKPTDLYDTAQAAYTTGASDLVLRLDGTAAKADVTTWKGDKWIKQQR